LPRGTRFVQSEYPKNPRNPAEDLLELTAGDKAVIAPIHPVVTVKKNYQYRQESISLKQDPQPTWCKILPRNDL
jgi:hypothetical protein